MLGAAWIAGAAVLPAIAASSNGRLVAIAARDAERARKMADPYPALGVLDSYEAVLADPAVDAVYIPLVNSAHREWTLRALEAGKHVLCEKPLAMNSAEAEKMAAAARSAGRLLMEAFMYRFHPRVQAVVAGLRDPMYVQASFGFRLSDPSNYRLRAEHGGGALLDVGCYVVSVARWILGEPAHVFAASHIVGEVDMTTSALLSFEGGAMAAVWSSFESPEEQELTVVSHDGAHRLGEPFTSRDGADPYQRMVESFADSVLHDRPAAIPLSESIANMKVLDRIRAAAARLDSASS
ncbi:MAG TPA: Gfo/Idh/MocA family oxidoreductase [Candidatus Dormibacteraeota bacterium]|nr:Gfo/Idh/MocA family oxidoreductase [Candidatus Dormibacteraeota bacterium]